MRSSVDRMLAAYGAELTLRHKETAITVRAFFQPVRARGHQYLEGVYGVFGEIPREQYIYLGPAEPAVQIGDTLCLDGREYVVRRAERIYGGAEPAYCWGACVEKGGSAGWTTHS